MIFLIVVCLSVGETYWCSLGTENGHSWSMAESCHILLPCKYALSVSKITQNFFHWTYIFFKTKNAFYELYWLITHKLKFLIVRGLRTILSGCKKSNNKEDMFLYLMVVNHDRTQTITDSTRKWTNIWRSTHFITNYYHRQAECYCVLANTWLWQDMCICECMKNDITWKQWLHSFHHHPTNTAINTVTLFIFKWLIVHQFSWDHLKQHTDVNFMCVNMLHYETHVKKNNQWTLQTELPWELVTRPLFKFMPYSQDWHCTRLQYRYKNVHISTLCLMYTS